MRRVRFFHGPISLWSALALLCAAPAARVHAQAPGGDPNRLTRQEIEAHPQLADALELIERLRPRFLQGRGRTSATAERSEPLVFLDETKLFSVDGLSTIPASNVEEIRFLTPTEAAARYGNSSTGGARNGVILVRTKRQITPKP